MLLDNRPTDRQADAHAVRLCGEEGAEQPVDIFRLDSDTGILDRNEYLIGSLLVRAYPQFVTAACHGTHGLNAVHKKIHHDLLQQDPITQHRRQRRRKFQLQGNTMGEHFVPEKEYCLFDHVIDIERHFSDVGLVRERADALEHLTRPIALVDDPPQGLARFAQVGSFAIEPAQASRGIGDDGGERLVHFVRDRGCQLAQGCDARGVRDLGLSIKQFLSGPFGRGDVHERPNEFQLACLISDGMGDHMDMFD